MKRKVFNAVLGATLLVAGALPGVAAASAGTITFAGKIESQTCVINGNGTGGSSFTVTLPTVNTSALASAGQVAGNTQFTIGLTGCGATPLAVTTYFEPGTNTDVATGNLKNTGAAGNVELQLQNSDFSVINAAAASPNSTGTTTTAAGTGTMTYYVQYVAVGGAATAGTVASSVTYSIVYP
jgi:major type 1 subunit fimbrin (pilin)